MKTLVTLLLAALPNWALAQAGYQPSYPAPPATAVNFSVERGLPFNLVLDGRPVTPPAAPQAHLDYLAPGQHWVELSPSGAAGPLGRNRPRVRTAVWLTEGLETSFVLTQRPGYGWQLRQVSAVALPGYGYEDQAGTYGLPAPAGQVYAPPADAPAGPGYPAAPGSGYPNGSGYPGGLSYPSGPGYPTGPGYPSGPGYAAGPGYAGGAGQLLPLSGPDAADLVQALQQCTFDSRRLPLFYQALARAAVRADDLAAMVHTMTYSESQKKAAEYGYTHLADPQSFHRVLAALTFPTDAGAVLTDLGLQP